MSTENRNKDILKKNHSTQQELENSLRKTEALNRSILASLDSHIAVLNKQGSIIAVNDSWMRYGRENGAASDEGIGPGMNYLQACHPAAEQGTDNADKMFEGIQDVLTGRKRYVEVEYPCHSPTEQHWYLMSVMPFLDEEGGAVVVHKEITELKNAQIALHKALSEIEELKNRLEQENEYLREEIQLEHNFSDIIGQSKPLKQALKKVEKVAPLDTTVLILGETGTGKELFARALHNRSTRQHRPLVKVNCATLPANLIESELFGHERGAFTGALQKKIGRFELANGGTIFLDEIGELPLELQAKLLRVLQEGEFERLGNPRTMTIDVRALAATNRNLEEEVRQGKFRQDLYYRLSVYTIPLPALRDRKSDIPLLVEALVEKLGKKLGRRIKLIPQKTMDMLQGYSWPGNVRELENVIERGIINSPEHSLRVELPDQPAFDLDEHKTLEEHERDYIIRTLKKTKWRIAGPKGAAGILGVNPSTLRSRIQKLNIRKPWE